MDHWEGEKGVEGLHTQSSSLTAAELVWMLLHRGSEVPKTMPHPEIKLSFSTCMPRGGQNHYILCKATQTKNLHGFVLVS